MVRDRDQDLLGIETTVAGKALIFRGDDGQRQRRLNVFEVDPLLALRTALADQALQHYCRERRIDPANHCHQTD